MKMSNSDNLLTKSEEDLMELFWEENRPLTSVEIPALKKDSKWNDSYIHIMLRSMLKKGVIKVCGVMQHGSKYARQFIPIVTREEYLARISISKGLGLKNIKNFSVALAKADKSNDEDLIMELENIIQELKDKRHGEH